MSRTDSVSRFHRRRLTGRLSPLRTVLGAVVLLGVGAFAAWVVFLSSWLAADKVAVAGATTISAREVETAAQVPLGTPLVRIDLNRIVAGVARLPVVRSVTVHRSWPHTIAIAITERQPVASRYSAGAWEVLDGQGVVFRHTATRPKGVPVIGVPGSAAGNLLPETARVAAALPADLASQTRRITAATMDSVTLRLKNGEVVLWGSSAESDRKVEVLTTLLANAKAGHYDVSVPGQPTTSQ